MAKFPLMTTDASSIRHVAIVGTGVIGSGWAAVYLAHGFTEFIEIDFETAVLLQSVEIGENRGTHSIVAIRAWDNSTGMWQELHARQADPESSDYYELTNQYHVAVPNMCETSFPTSRLRIEMVRAFALRRRGEDVFLSLVSPRAHRTPFRLLIGTSSTMSS